MSVDTIIRLRTHGKVNLFLRVIGLRRDGFHEVETILHGVNLYDEIEMERSNGGIDVTMDFVEGLTGTLPSNEENLIARAAKLLTEGLENESGAVVRVKKGIPVAAGLGGGSSNAAGALTALAEMWGIELDRNRLFALAEKLGADVPYCLDGGTALATSRGEQLTPLPNIRPMWFVLGGSTEPLLTRDVYELWDETGPGEESSPVPLSMALGAGDYAEVAALLHNDLEVPAFALRPELREKKALLVEAGALGASMSGSGPTTFGIAADEESASAIAEKVRDSFDWVRVATSQTACIERLD